MTQEATPDVLNFGEPPKSKLPGGLNVLTILTFIWCAFELYQSISGFFSGKKSLEEMEKAQEQLAGAPAWAKKMAGSEVMEMIQQGLDNKVPLFIIGLVAVGLCVYGALQMRKLKKEGYFMWLAGELLPFISAAIFMPALFKTIYIYFSVFPVIFIILYTLQRKHLVN